MKFPRFALLAAPALILVHTLGASVAKAGEVQDIMMKKSGQVVVSTGSCGEMIIVPTINDVSTGTWKSLKVLEGFPESSGLAVSGKGEFEALDGQPVSLKVSVKADGNQIDAQASWVAERAVMGHARLDLFLSNDVIGQLIGSVDGAEVNFEKPPAQIRVGEEFQFLRKSDREPVMKLVFPEGPYKISFARDGGSLNKTIGPGMIIRISSRADSGGDPSLDEPSDCKWQLVFQK